MEGITAARDKMGLVKSKVTIKFYDSFEALYWDIKPGRDLIQLRI